MPMTPDQEFSLLRDCMACWPSIDVPRSPFHKGWMERVRQALLALCESPGHIGIGDLTGLIGHMVHAGKRPVRVPRSVRWPQKSDWEQAGLSVNSNGPDFFLLEPGCPWTPGWLVGSCDNPPLRDALDELPRRRPVLPGEFRADPCLVEIMGPLFAEYTSPGQRQALRTVFLSPPGSTLLVSVPTGSGKSLLIWAPAMAYADMPGLTLVVVPTVALALDQERQMRDRLQNVGRSDRADVMVWHGDLPEEDRKLVRERIRDGRQLILFTSPEAVVTGLSPALFDAVERRLLRNFVVDEAHLLAQWGYGFRPEYQVLPGLRREWLRMYKGDRPFRTLLLTATVTGDCYYTLRTLFGNERRLPVAAAVHLRPEPAYWIHPAAGEEEQQTLVLEVLRCCPRPVLLYVSLRKDAEVWTEILRSHGVQRVDFVHGGKRGELRAEVVDRWRQNELDIVVANSAFGVGMDKGDVRTVIHACIPETVDRFYQEVGRGGRDGKACLSVLVHTYEDRVDAERLNRETLISVERGLERWNQMLVHAQEISGREGLLRIDLNSKPTDILADSPENVAWNVRTLTLMVRAGLLALEYEPPPKPDVDETVAPEEADAIRRRAFDQYFTSAVVRIVNPGHRSRAEWERLVETERQRTGRAAREALGLMDDVLQGTQEFSELLTEVYTIVTDDSYVVPTPVCGGCPECRRNGDTSLRDYELPPMLPQDIEVELAATLRLLVASRGQQIVVVYNPPGIRPREQRQWQSLVLEFLLPRLVERGITEICAGPAWREHHDYRRLYLYSPRRFVIHREFDEQENSGDEPQTPRVTVLDPAKPAAPIPDHLLGLFRPFHLLLVPDNVLDPNRPGQLYRHQYPTMTLEDLVEVLNR